MSATERQEWNDWSHAYHLGIVAHFQGHPRRCDPSLSAAAQRGFLDGWDHGKNHPGLGTYEQALVAIDYRLHHHELARELAWTGQRGSGR